jgi:hypothetical protein
VSPAPPDTTGACSEAVIRVCLGRLPGRASPPCRLPLVFPSRDKMDDLVKIRARLAAFRDEWEKAEERQRKLRARTEEFARGAARGSAADQAAALAVAAGTMQSPGVLF